MLIKEGMTVLFQGDSITDCGRRESIDDMGYGYAMLIANSFVARYPHIKANFLNRGISGDRVKDMAARWEEDCISLKPDVLSILIGINDTWRRYDSNEMTTAEDYKACYHELLSRAKSKTGAKLIICEPFLLPHPKDRLAWREDLDPKIQATRELARQFGALYIPLDGIFAAASTQQPCQVWADDGVHPTMAGHMLIANAWMDAVFPAH